MVQLGQVIRGLADTAAKRGWIFSTAVGIRKQRGCGGDWYSELQSRTAARHDDRRDGRFQVYDAAVHAAEYVWENWGSRGLYAGGTSDNPNYADKEAGMLSIEAFLSLYESTKEQKWLERAKAAADFTETWIWIWDLPMPLDADDDQLHWKKGVPIIGLQGIATRARRRRGYVYVVVCALLRKVVSLHERPPLPRRCSDFLHGNKSMIALPGRHTV
jgi:hypothetical protein